MMPSTKMTMNDALTMVREILRDQKRYREFINDDIEEIIKSSANIDESELPIARALLQLTLFGNADIIQDHCESPIEQMFFNAVNLIPNLIADYNFIRFVPSTPSANDYISGLNEKLQYAKELMTEFLKLPGASRQRFRPYLEWLSTQGTVESEFASKMEYFDWIYNIANFQNAFHLTIQAWLDGITIKGKRVRTDLLVWLPLNDSFKLVVECDGFEFHKSKDAFTNDRQRDRALKAAGYEVFRFSGPELYRNAMDCAKELVEYLIKCRQRIPILPRWPESDDQATEEK